MFRHTRAFIIVSYTVYHIAVCQTRQQLDIFSSNYPDNNRNFVSFSDFIQLLVNYNNIHVDGMTAENALAHNNRK